MKRLAPIFVVLFLVGCSTTKPVEIAETPEQRAFAAYATFVIYEETGARMIQDPQVPDEVKFIIQATDAIAKPAADVMLIAALAVEHARGEVAIGQDDSALAKLQIAISNLNAAYMEAKPKISALRAAVKEFGSTVRGN